MKMLRMLFLVAAVCGLSASSAFGSSINFHTNILDPIDVNEITTNNFMFSFSACQPNEVPDGIAADGCFAGANETGQAWTSLTLTFAGSVLSGATVDCTPAPFNPQTESDPNLFSVISGCSAGGDSVTVTFSNGNIPTDAFPVDSFLIIETGITPDEYGDITSTGAANAPEPQSFVLMFTGMLLLGSFCSPRIRQLVRG
jgi:hypothetical protein